MRTKTQTLLPVFAAVLYLAAASAYARHGAPASTDRDSWINDHLRALVGQGALPAPSRSFDTMTNLEAAENVARASERLLAQLPGLELPEMDPLFGSAPAAAPSGQAAVAPSAPEPVLVAPEAPVATPAPKVKVSSKKVEAVAGTPLAYTPEIQKLVLEFRKELAVMGVDVDGLLARMKNRKNLYEKLAARQEKALTRTGVEVAVNSRGYLNTYQTFGSNVNKAQDASIYNNLHFKSVPVPKLLFEADMRVWGTYGKYFQDQVQILEWRTLTLTNYNEICTIQVGDFFNHLTPLTLWNYSSVHTLLEPRPMKWSRTDREEIVMMDKGEDWRLRGGRISTAVVWPDSSYLNKMSWEVAGGPVKAASTADFASYWAAAQGTLELADKDLVIRGTGLRLWDDMSSANVSYVNDFPKTWGQRYEIGSVNPSLTLPVSKNLKFKANWEGCFSRYNDDMQNGGRLFHDWASLGWGGIHYKDKFELTGRMYDVGPHFYSPGAQTLRWTVGPGAGLEAPAGYVSSAEQRDLSLPGYRNRFLFSDITRPAFAPYSRVDENIFPYGDATPNRQGFTVGTSMKIGKKNWFKPRVYFTKAEEIKANLVTVPQTAPSFDAVVDVESGLTDRTPRKFSGLDAAVELDIAAALGKKTTLALGFEYKSQTTDLGIDAATLPLGWTEADFKVNSMTVMLDVVPPHKWFKWADISLGIKSTKIQGTEYGLNGHDVAAYPFYGSADDLGAYSRMYFDLTKTQLLAGIKYSITKTTAFRGDFIATKNNYVWSTIEDTRSQNWRVMYEAAF